MLIKKIKIAAIFTFIIINNIGAFISLRNEDKSLKLNIVEKTYTSVYNTEYKFITGLNQNIEKIYHYAWNQDEQYWELKEEFENDYNVNENIIQITYSNWIDWFKEFEDSRKWTYKYNNQERVIEKEGYIFVDSAWQLDTKTEDYYDEEGNLLKSNELQWNKERQEWVGSRKTENSFTDYGHLQQTNVARWNPEMNDWVQREKSLYYFSPEEDTISKVSQIWDKDSLEWKNETKTEKFFTDSVNYHEKSYLWNDTLAEKWFNHEIYITSYNALGLETTQNKYEFNKENQSWYNSWKVEYVYNEDSLLIRRSIYNWDEITKSLLLSRKRELEYNAQGGWTKTVEYNWNKTTGNWDFSNKWDIALIPHGPQVTTIQQNAEDYIKIYPNPAKSAVTIQTSGEHKITSISLYDLTGKKIIAENYPQAIVYKHVNLENLPQGLYIFTIETNEKTIQRKIKLIN